MATVDEATPKLNELERLTDLFLRLSNKERAFQFANHQVVREIRSGRINGEINHLTVLREIFGQQEFSLIFSETAIRMSTVDDYIGLYAETRQPGRREFTDKLAQAAKIIAEADDQTVDFTVYTKIVFTLAFAAVIDTIYPYEAEIRDAD